MSHDKSIEAQTILDKDNIKVLRINIKADATLPEHSAKEEVLIIVIRGKGIFKIGNEAKDIQPGDIISLQPNEVHAVTAKDDLELMVAKIKFHP